MDYRTLIARIVQDTMAFDSMYLFDIQAEEEAIQDFFDEEDEELDGIYAQLDRFDKYLENEYTRLTTRTSSSRTRRRKAYKKRKKYMIDENISCNWWVAPYKKTEKKQNTSTNQRSLQERRINVCKRELCRARKEYLGSVDSVM